MSSGCLFHNADFTCKAINGVQPREEDRPPDDFSQYGAAQGGSRRSRFQKLTPDTVEARRMCDGSASYDLGHSGALCPLWSVVPACWRFEMWWRLATV